MKQMQIQGHIITFISEDVQPRAAPSDEDIVRQLYSSPETPPELRALAGMILSVCEQKNEMPDGKGN